MIPEIILPWPPKALSPNARVHWSVKSKAAKAYRAACWVETLRAGLRDRLPEVWNFHLWIDFYRPTRRVYDADNCLSSIKSGIDGIADALGVNDSRFVFHPFVCDQIGGMVKVRITAGPSA